MLILNALEKSAMIYWSFACLLFGLNFKSLKAVGVTKIIFSREMHLPVPAPVPGNIHDVPNVRLHNIPRLKYVRDGGRTGSKVLSFYLS